MPFRKFASVILYCAVYFFYSGIVHNISSVGLGDEGCGRSC